MTIFASELIAADIPALIRHGVQYPPGHGARQLRDGRSTPAIVAAALADSSSEATAILAQTARDLRTRRFGNAIKIYAPVYVSNECVNACRYCGFSARSDIRRTTLAPNDVISEARLLIERGHRHLLLVAGESASGRVINIIGEAAEALRPHAASLAVEVGPLSAEQYRRLATAGIDGVTLYQETYDRAAYRLSHPTGPKADFDGRIANIETAGAAGMRFLGIGVLLGLADWRHDIVALYLHARRLERRYWRSQITISIPRLRDVPKDFPIPYPVTDDEFARIIMVLRCALPDAGIILSTREPAALRDRLMTLGITQMSAGSRTEPGGYMRPNDAGHQFAVEDVRSPDEIAAALHAAGLDPVFKDWEGCLH